MKLLLLNPSYMRTYGSNHAGIANPVYPVLSLAVLAGAAREAGHKVDLVDLSYTAYNPKQIEDLIRKTAPDVLGVTATTPLVNQMKDISFIAKRISDDILVVGGGSHPSSLAVETLKESRLDIVVSGEGDRTLQEILAGKALSEIQGIYWRNGDEIIANPARPLVENLDDLPMPAWDLYPIEEYRKRITKIITRHPPVSTIEFSRGCVFQCDFCASKQTMGLGYRKKSPERCAEEMAYLEKLGYGEALLTDDIFTSDNHWAVSVCEAISRRKLKIVWTCTNGIRVDSANKELFVAMKKAGCYRVHFGFESGNDAVLKAFGKGGKATLAQGIRAVEEARGAGLETWGMYMFGLSSDTTSTMEDTIKYARRTPVNVMKFGITVPFPGTPMFNQLRKSGHIKTFDWDDYNVYNEANSIFDHPTLAWDQITQAYRKAYLKLYYLNPRYMLRRLWRGIKTGEFFWDAYFAIKFGFLLSKKATAFEKENYAFQDEWRKLSVSGNQMTVYELPRAKGNRPPVWRGSIPAAS